MKTEVPEEVVALRSRAYIPQCWLVKVVKGSRTGYNIKKERKVLTHDVRLYPPLSGKHSVPLLPHATRDTQFPATAYTPLTKVIIYY